MRFSLQNNTSYSNINVLYNSSQTSIPSLFSERTEQYRYGFNGKEKDDEVKGSGNSYDFGARIYDPRLGRWLAVDPMASKLPDNSPYEYTLNNPIVLIDPTGKFPEDPIDLFPKKENKTYYEAARNIKTTKGDGIFYVFGHANSKAIGYEDANGQKQVAKTAKQFDKMMRSKSEAWKDAMESGKKIVLVLYACNMASEEYIGHDGKKVSVETTIAEKISQAFPNVTVVAADGYVMYGQTVDIIDDKVVVTESKIVGVSNHKNDGGFITIKDGKKISKRLDRYNGKGEQPTEGPKMDKILEVEKTESSTKETKNDKK